MEKKEKDIIEIMETPIEKMGISVRLFNALSRNNQKTIEQIVKSITQNKTLTTFKYSRENELKELKNTLEKYGINIDDKEQCQNLIDEYYMKKTNSINTGDLKSIQQLQKLLEKNEAIENEISLKERILEEIKIQIRRSEFLKQQQAECDEEYKKLIEQYNSLNTKESNNSHGTK